MKDRYDVIVVGAGPAGCCTATLLAGQGHDVLLVEKEKFPRYHIVLVQRQLEFPGCCLSD